MAATAASPASPPPAAVLGAAPARRSSRLPPAGRFRKENSGLVVSGAAVSRLCSGAPLLPSVPAAATAPSASVLAAAPASLPLPHGAPSGSSAAAVDDEQEEAMVPQTLLSSSTPSGLLVCQVGGGHVQAAPVALNAPSTSSPAAPVASWFGTSDAADVEEDEEELAPQTPRSATVDGEAAAGALPVAAASWPAPWVSASDNDDEDDEEELVPRTPPAPKFFNDDVVVDKVDGREVECVASALDGWQEVMPRRGPRRPALPSPSVARRHVPAWLKGRCCRCLAPGHRAAVCCDPLRCSRCFENGHRARDCRNAWRPLSLLADLVASSPSQAKAPHRAQVEVSLPSDVPHRRSWASVVSAPVSSLASTDMQSAMEKPAEFFQEAVRPLQEAIVSLHGWMLAIGGFLERAEAVLGRLSQTPVDPLVPPNVGKVGTSGEGLHGCFSPRATVCSAIKAPVMQIMPELLELCGGVVTPPPVEEVRLGSHRLSDPASPPCQAPEKCVAVDVAVSPSPESGRQVVLIGDGVAKSGLLPIVDGAVVAREVCDFLATLAVAYPRSAVG
ncbi:hypothetical protein QYE76_050310 [Lolium multiflorum]|uniref:CCHC-type domain-containing protein n=1 Tax=Lolium multiflorum TaxID=4521 RepID=A0AAD8SRF3_LOLMU|nr:hypothetical protein QYE76_050310 [Lolium multiflorum]